MTNTIAPHPSVYIKGELKARGWTLEQLAQRMPGTLTINALSLYIYLEAGPTHTNCRLGEETAQALGQAFDVAPELFLNLEAAWLRGKGVDA